MSVVTRFAPSPTGFLHIGSARTALFNYLFARRHNGKFLLRIEDTDQKRLNEQATEAIINSLKWLDLAWDGEIIFQSRRSQRHKEAALQLLTKGAAYYCFTPQEEINAQRSQAIANNQHFIFHSPWRDAHPSTYPANGIKPVIRLKAPRSGCTIIRDTLQGEIKVNNSQLDDMVLLRSDETPTYMLAVVVDDHDMEITHIIRGDDHLTNAARQIAIYQAFEWQIPSMTHIPLIYGSDGAKLSKRHGALGVEAYREMGYLPEALCNYLLRLGWAHNDDEIISRQQAIEWFNLEGLGKSPARLDFAKMKHLNAHYIRHTDDETLFNIIISHLQKEAYVSNETISYIKQAIDNLKIRAALICDLVNLAKIYWVDRPVQYSQEALSIIENCNKNILRRVIQELEKIETFDKTSIQSSLTDLSSSLDLKIGALMQPIRALISGLNNSPSVFEIMAIIGKQHSIKRLKQQLD